jgi:hypothetical protein
MAIAAGVTFAEGTGGEQAAGVMVLTLVAASTVAVPVIAYVLAAVRMRGALGDLKSSSERTRRVEARRRPNRVKRHNQP